MELSDVQWEAFQYYPNDFGGDGSTHFVAGDNVDTINMRDEVLIVTKAGKPRLYPYHAVKSMGPKPKPKTSSKVKSRGAARA